MTSCIPVYKPYSLTKNTMLLLFLNYPAEINLFYRNYVWYRINRKMVNAIRFQLIPQESEADLCVCTFTMHRNNNYIIIIH